MEDRPDYLRKNSGDTPSAQEGPQKSTWEHEIIDVLESIENDYSQFTKNFNTLRKNLQGFIDETDKQLKDIKRETERKVESEDVEKNVGLAKKQIKDVDKKLHNVMDEIGFGESLDVSKIPPKILENVYESTLEDIVLSMKRNLGTHDMDIKVRDALELMRSRTSGSELFQFDGRKIRVKNLVPSIEQKLISAKQVHSTYTELLSKLIENIPHYEPKNFRAMMKAKSLEFAIDKVTTLIERTNQIETRFNNTTHIVSSLTNQLNSKFNEMEERMSSLEKNIEIMIQDRFSEYNRRLDELESSTNVLKDIEEDISSLELFEKEKTDLENRLGELSATLDMEVAKLEKEIGKLSGADIEAYDDLTEEEKFIYYAIPEGGGTLNAIENTVGDVVDDVDSKIESMLEKDMLNKLKRGRWTIYERKSADDISIIEEEVSEEEVSEEEISEEEASEVDEALSSKELILSRISEDGCTLARLNREVEELDKAEIEAILSELINDDILTTIKRNRWTIYMKAPNNMEVK